MKKSIDLNADLGEGGLHDEAILACVSSVNIACGWHAGDTDTMRRAITAALQHDVAIGAHPGYPDKVNFGRLPMTRTPQQVYDDVLYQIGALESMVKAAGGKLGHVKPHGALYNQASIDPALADAIAAAVHAANPTLCLVGLAGSELIEAAHRHAVIPIAEGFADRAYLSAGTLAPRDKPGSVFGSVPAVLHQTMALVEGGQIATLDGPYIRLEVDTICLHGDGEYALALAQGIRNMLNRAGITISAYRAC
ncbi:5-oxoprolinase subunit PxpA [Aeromonas dhakensis]|uniref:5-oxoprolinase subunit PxpA n=1 Tax=Aeromonas dhakensis TaxID=196024 RepID=UPI0039882FF1